MSEQGVAPFDATGLMSLKRRQCRGQACIHRMRIFSTCTNPIALYLVKLKLTERLTLSALADNQHKVNC